MDRGSVALPVAQGQRLFEIFYAGIEKGASSTPWPKAKSAATAGCVQPYTFFPIVLPLPHLFLGNMRHLSLLTALR
jgi:hypothetical protein